MTKFGVLGATALSLSLAIATPVLAQQGTGGRGGAHAASGHMGGGARMGAGPRMQSNVRGGQANMGGANFAGRGNAQLGQRGNGQFAQGGNAQFGQRGNGQFAQRGEWRGDRGRGYGYAAGAVAAGVATGAALAAGSYGYSDPYYGDNYAYDQGYSGDNYGYDNSYAYDNGATYSTGIPLVTFDQSAQMDQGQVGGDASYCAQRYRSYDPASGTYLGYDGQRHPCIGG
jgi:BA14K-like protein